MVSRILTAAFALALLTGSALAQAQGVFPSGSAGKGSKSDANSFPIAPSTETKAQFGATNETAPASDTATSGLNGRLQRIAQNITTLIGWVDGLEGFTDGIEGLIGTTNSTLTTINGNVDGLEGFVDGLETLIGTTNTNTSNTATNTSTTASNTTTIVTNTQAIDDNTDGIEGLLDLIRVAVETLADLNHIPPAVGTATSFNDDDSPAQTCGPSNVDRTGWMVQNFSPAYLWVHPATGTATTSNSYRVDPNGGYFNLPLMTTGVYTGDITCIWSSDLSGYALVTEYE